MTKDQITGMKIDEFNENVSEMPPPMQAKLKDSRRKGKNRIAARRSRDKKNENMAKLKKTLEEQIAEEEEAEREYSHE